MNKSATTKWAALHLALGSVAAAALAMGVPSCLGSSIPTVETQADQFPEGHECECFDVANCGPPEAESIKVRVEPSFVVLAPGQTRSARVVVDPDFCVTDSERNLISTTVTFDSSDTSVVAAPADGSIDYGGPTIDLSLAAEATGSTTITVNVPTHHPEKSATPPATATIDIEVLEPTLGVCTSQDDTTIETLAAGTSIEAAGTLQGATITLPDNADMPNDNGFQWSVAPFDTSIHCADSIVPEGYIALGPAVRFSPDSTSFPRDMPLSIPLNPARMPESARWRHLRIAHSSPAFVEPRTFLATDPTVVKRDGVWRLEFQAPRLGTFQAVVQAEAGKRTRARRVTHRAIVGVSMGGAGAAQFGLRHHHLFDVVAALGGPVDWTWLIDHLEQNHFGGFRPIAPGTQLADIQLERTICTDGSECQPDETCLPWRDPGPGFLVKYDLMRAKCTLMPEADEPYEHPTTFNTWWYEIPGQGHGGSFDREEYLQIFRDLALMYGNPIGYNPLALHLPAGVDPAHPAQAGTSGDCGIYVKPIDGDPNEEAQKDKFDRCPAERCAQTQTLTNYYDDEFNPDGSFPVITFCDGSRRDDRNTPWANTWYDFGNGYPMEVALAVDYNGNGVRDELEPVIKAGHEPWSDWGVDQTPSAIEPGYGPDNLDPSGDDYDPRFNPGGTEADHRWQQDEPFDDHGLDGVDGTISSPYDHGEDDGQFTVSPGLQRFWDMDAHSMVRGWADPMMSSPLDDDALARIDLWTDGGNRDLFNFAVAADHFMGGFVLRDRNAAIFSDLTKMPGLDPSLPDAFNPARVVWEDLQGVIHYRYGKDEPDQNDIDNGSGQHVGTVNELAGRLQAALYFVDSRWPDAPRARFQPSTDDPVGDESDCEVQGNCTFNFTSSDGRDGVVGVTLPPGYANAKLQHVRYPVIYILHGYGMVPEDLQLAIVFLANWMNGSFDSQASRLGKAILVYADGRCREQAGEPECIRGTFFTDSIRPEGPQMDNWWLELIDEVDRRYRTLGETTVEWTD